MSVCKGEGGVVWQDWKRVMEVEIIYKHEMSDICAYISKDRRVPTHMV